MQANQLFPRTIKMRFPFWKIVSVLESRLTIVWGKQARKDRSCWFVKFLRLSHLMLLQRQTKLNFTLVPSYSPIYARIGLSFILCLVNRVNWEGPNIQQSDSETSARSITVLSWRVDLNFHLTLWILKLGDASILQYIFYAVWTQLRFDQKHKYEMRFKIQVLLLNRMQNIQMSYIYNHRQVLVAVNGVVWGEVTSPLRFSMILL